jgi:phage anti-repressor protein
MATSIVAFSQELAQQLADSTEQFPVDFDLAWGWMGYTRRDNAARKLKHFKESNHFLKVEEVVERGQGGGSARYRYWLTIDCFKSLAMMAQTEQGDQVREYFLECERIAKSKEQKPMSQLELAVFSAQKLLEQETRLTAIEIQNQLLIEQNQYLSQQVKLLKSSTEALELETEANAVELQRYRNGHGRYYSIVAWCNLHGYTLSLQECNSMGRKASAMCRIQDIVPQPVNDPRFGTVNSYPDRVLEELDWEAL